MDFSLEPPALRHDGHAVGADELARCGFVGSRQVEEVVHRVGFTLAHEVIVLGPADHLAAVGDGLYVILVLVAGLIQSVLRDKKKRET